MNGRYGRIEHGEQTSHMRLNEPPIIIGPKRSDPAIEELHSLGTSGDLSIEITGRRVDQPHEEGIPGPLVPVHERFGSLVMTGPTPFDGVASQSERRPGKP